MKAVQAMGYLRRHKVELSKYFNYSSEEHMITMQMFVDLIRARNLYSLHH